MEIKCWGSRGSIAVSGEKYLKYGGDTTCLNIKTKSGHQIVIDAGTGVRRLGNQMIAEGCMSFHFIFTHAHWDHVMGFPFFKPIFQPNVDFQMHKCPFASKFVETVLSRVMSKPYFPVKFSEIAAQLVFEDACPMVFEIGSVTITPIPISHPNSGAGYKFVEDGKTFVFLTDNELGYTHPGGLKAEAYAEFCSGADLLIHDAEYTQQDYQTTKTWGHSTYGEAVDMAMLAGGVKKLGLFHLNQDRTDDQVDEIVAECQGIIAANNGDMECFAVGSDMSFTL